MTDRTVDEALRAAADALGFDRFAAHGAGGAWRLTCGTDAAFVKLLPRAAAPRLAAEAEGLAALAPALRVPAVLARDETASRAWLALEWLELRTPDAACAAQLGRALAAAHRRSVDAFGWDGDNWIGAAPQVNGWLGDWAQFFAERRLVPQLAAAQRNGGGELADRGERLLGAVPQLLAGHAPPPSLIHGDLWGGNWGALPGGEPIVFDPAVHYADRECDLAMSELFGGFPRQFYAAYEEAWPLDSGYERRRDLYQLYHLLNHFNLFGGDYRRRAGEALARLLAAAG